MTVYKVAETIGKKPELDIMNLPEDFKLVCPMCGKEIHPKRHDVKEKNGIVHGSLHCPNCFVNLTERPK